jgi:hypothetical protein
MVLGSLPITGDFQLAGDMRVSINIHTDLHISPMGEVEISYKWCYYLINFKNVIGKSDVMINAVGICYNLILECSRSLSFFFLPLSH